MPASSCLCHWRTLCCVWRKHLGWFLPRWSDQILAEVSRNLVAKFSKSETQAKRRENALRLTFPEALVEEYEPLVEFMTNREHDRHVLAAAVSSGAKLIVTSNLKHFPETSIRPWGIERQGPSTFLSSLYDLAPGIVMRKLSEQAQTCHMPLEEFLLKLRLNAPSFVALLCDEERISLTL